MKPYWKALLPLALGSLGARLSEEIRQELHPVAPYLRRLGGGMALILISGGLWLITLLFLLVALFFSLGSNSAYAMPALWTAAISFLISLLTAFSGFRMVRRPRIR